MNSEKSVNETQQSLPETGGNNPFGKCTSTKSGGELKTASCERPNEPASEGIEDVEIQYETEKPMGEGTECGEIENSTECWVPREGMEFNTSEEAWKFWQNYAAKMGFGARKHFANKDRKTSVITSRRFLCNREGYRGKDKRAYLIKGHTAKTRTGCLARMGIVLIRETGKYRLHDFVPQHNHELSLTECVHASPLQRKMSDVQAINVELADGVGLAQERALEVSGRQTGGRKRLEWPRLDEKNYLPSKRQRALAYGEVGYLLEFLQKQLLEDPSFFYALQLDNSEHITNILWADAKMRIDYALFGDVVTFYTAVSTNREYRPLVVFLGFNHHRRLVIFGAALLYDETLESFSWLFDTFLKVHKSKKPDTILTDHDAKMEKALCELMPETRHGLCTWHIMQNAVKHLGNLLNYQSFFLRDLKKLMYEYEDGKKFEEEWKVMLSLYKVEDNSWLKGMYRLKEKWAECYMKTAITLGMRTAQLSESLHGDLKDYLKSNIDITGFLEHFQIVVEESRYKEKQAEYDARKKLPRLKVETLPLLQQAVEVYTPSTFEVFQQEWEKSLMIVIKRCKANDTFHEYLVGSYGDEGEHIVIGNPSFQKVFCTCKLFETFGILCSHALKVLDLLNIKVIPHDYIVKRWTRDARDGTFETSEEARLITSKLQFTNRYRELRPVMVELATIASDFQEGYALMKNSMTELRKTLFELREKHYSNVGNGI